MQDSEWSLGPTSDDDDDYHLARPACPQELRDRFGIRISLLVLCISLLMAALWVVSSPSFSKCSEIESTPERHACYDLLRSELLKPPAKGGDFSPLIQH